jgi:hypothetical protein
MKTISKILSKKMKVCSNIWIFLTKANNKNLRSKQTLSKSFLPCILTRSTTSKTKFKPKTKNNVKSFIFSNFLVVNTKSYENQISVLTLEHKKQTNFLQDRIIALETIERIHSKCPKINDVKRNELQSLVN